MPFGKIIVDADPVEDELRFHLIREWRGENPASDEPVIIEAPGDRFNPSTHLYVIWNRWGSLSQQRRSEVIMEAYEQRYGRDPSLNVTVAMGLTPGEADRLGIPYR